MHVNAGRIEEAPASGDRERPEAPAPQRAAPLPIVTSLVMLPLERPIQRRTVTRKLSPRQQLALAALDECAAGSWKLTPREFGQVLELVARWLAAPLSARPSRTGDARRRGRRFQASRPMRRQVSARARTNRGMRRDRAQIVGPYVGPSEQPRSPARPAAGANQSTSSERRGMCDNLYKSADTANRQI